MEAWGTAGRLAVSAAQGSQRARLPACGVPLRGTRPLNAAVRARGRSTPWRREAVAGQFPGNRGDASPLHLCLCNTNITLKRCAFSPTKQALEKYNIEKEIAAFIKKQFDSKYGPTWHCIVGRNFGASRVERRQGGWVLLCRRQAPSPRTPRSPLTCRLCRLLRDARDQALHLLLPGPSGGECPAGLQTAVCGLFTPLVLSGPPLQVWLEGLGSGRALGGHPTQSSPTPLGLRGGGHSLGAVMIDACVYEHVATHHDSIHFRAH